MENENKEETKELTMKERIERVSRKVEELEDKETKKVKFWLPWKARPSKNQIKTNWITIQYINENKELSFIKAPIEEGVVLVDGVPHVPTPESIVTYKGKPWIIQPSWNTQPFMADIDYQRAKEDGTISRGWKLILNRYKNEAIAIKKSWSTGTIVIGIIVLIVVGYLATKGGKLF